MTAREFFRRVTIFRTSLILLLAFVAGAFLLFTALLSAARGEWFKFFKIIGLFAFVALIARIAIAAARARTK
jgi:hypothetical protein